MTCQHQGLSHAFSVLDSDLTHFPVSLGLENGGYRDDLFRAWLVHSSLSSDGAVVVFFVSIPPYRDHSSLIAIEFIFDLCSVGGLEESGVPGRSSKGRSRY